MAPPRLLTVRVIANPVATTTAFDAQLFPDLDGLAVDNFPNVVATPRLKVWAVITSIAVNLVENLSVIVTARVPFMENRRWLWRW